MSFKQGVSRMLEHVHERHDVLVKVRNALLIYLVILAVFRGILWIGSSYAQGEAYAAFTLYSSFGLVILGGVGVAVYSYFGIKSSKNGGMFEKERKKLAEEEKRMSSIRKELKKQEKELQVMLKQGSQAGENTTNKNPKTDGLITRLFAKSPDTIKMKEEKEKLRQERKALEEEKRALKKQLAELKEAEKKNAEAARKAEIRKPRKKKSVKGFSKMPSSRPQRVEMYRAIAKQIQDDKGSFTISGIMESIVMNFPSKVDEDRKAFLKEIEEWVTQDPYTPQLRVEDGVKIFRMITKK